MFLTSGSIVFAVGDTGPGRYWLKTRLNGVAFVYQCTWPLYAYLNGVTLVFHLCWCSGTKRWSRKTTIVLYCTTSSFVCAWCSMVVTGVIQSLVHTASKNFDVDCRPLSVCVVDGIPKLYIQWSTIIVAIAVAVVQKTVLPLLILNTRPSSPRWNGFQISCLVTDRLYPWPHTSMVRKVVAGKTFVVCC